MGCVDMFSVILCDLGTRIDCTKLVNFNTMVVEKVIASVCQWESSDL